MAERVICLRNMGESKDSTCPDCGHGALVHPGVISTAECLGCRIEVDLAQDVVDSDG